jgi:hypothetical protein
VHLRGAFQFTPVSFAVHLGEICSASRNMHLLMLLLVLQTALDLRPLSVDAKQILTPLAALASSLTTSYFGLAASLAVSRPRMVVSHPSICSLPPLD